MPEFEDVCRHEAGHAVIAHLNGLLTLRILVRQHGGGEWVGFRHGTGGHPLARMNVAAGGMAGELIGHASEVAKVEITRLISAHERCRDDRETYQELALATNSATPFRACIEEHCWPAIQANRVGFENIVAELMAKRQVGPLVLAEFMYGLDVSTLSRMADQEFLARLQATRPAPDVP